jgi:hypothetical protein
MLPKLLTINGVRQRLGNCRLLTKSASLHQAYLSNSIVTIVLSLKTVVSTWGWRYDEGLLTLEPRNCGRRFKDVDVEVRCILVPLWDLALQVQRRKVLPIDLDT